MKQSLLTICIFFIFCIFEERIFAQDFTENAALFNLDSLKKVLLTEKEDTNKVNTLHALSHKLLILGDHDNSMKYVQQSLSLAKKLNYKRGEARAYFQIGGIVENYGNEGEVLKNMYLAKDIYLEINDNYGTGEVLMAMGAWYRDQGNDSTALQYLEKSLKIYQDINNKKSIAWVSNIIAAIYSEQGNYTAALNQFFAALKIFSEPGMPAWGVPSSYYGIALAYDGEATAFAEKKDMRKASIYYKEAVRYQTLSLNGYRQISWKNGFASQYIMLGNLNIKLGNFLSAKYYLDSAMQTARKQNDKASISLAYESLSDLEAKERKFEEALKDYKQSVIYKDSLNTNENSKKIAQVEMQRDYDKKEQAAKSAQREKDAAAKHIRSQQYFAITSLGLLVLAGLIIALIQFKNNKQKQKANHLLEKQKQKVETTLSELKATQSQLIQSEKMASLGELTAGIAHEIQNPLNFVNNFSEVNTELIEEAEQEIERGNIQDIKTILHDIKENGQKINHHGKRADAIVKGMLQHSRTSSAEKEPTDINKLADEYLKLAYHGLRAKDKSFNVSLKTNYDPNIGKANIIAQDIGRVLLNLINNAFYAVDEKKKRNIDGYEPTVSISTRKLTNQIEVVIKDNGNGIPQKILDKIFQPFFTTKPTGQGTGLGLSLAYDIVKTHGGEIKVEATEGEGSEFVVQLPI